MARRTQTYAIRLAVEGGGQVKAELVSVGQSGEQSLKRIETAGDRASGGLKGVGRQAELLRTGIRTLGGALAGVATVGGLAALVDRSISAANAIGKTADTIGVGVEALQELRFAAKASGVEQQTLDMALQRFTRRAAEAAQGTGEAKDALAQIGIALRDQGGNLRSSEDLLGDVADAFARIEDPAERLRLAFKLFDSEGVALVNLLSDGGGALEEMRKSMDCRKARVALGLAIERQTAQVQSLWIAVVDVAPEVIIRAKTVEAPIEVAEDHERHQLLRSLVDPGFERGALRRQGHTVRIGRALKAAFMTPGFEVHTQQLERVAVLLHEDLGAPSDRSAIRGMDHPQARHIALADRVKHATPDREPRVEGRSAALP